jgi:GT2 family glycosyltransferase
MSVKIALILLHWNNAQDTLECLESLSRIQETEYETIVVDNGSTDGSLTTLQAAFPHHLYLENGENLGFAEGNNRGIALALDRGADLIVLLNNDTVVAPNFLKELQKAAEEHPNVGVFGPTIYYYDEPATVWYAGGSVDAKSGRCYHIGCGNSSAPATPQCTDYICGCALAMRSEVVEKVGLLDPRFFLIWEEIDWCYRARKAGFQCLVVPTARVWHKVSSSFPEGNRGPMWSYFYFRNRLLFHKLHSSKRRAISWEEGLALLKETLHPTTPKSVRKGHLAALMGICDYYLGRFGKGRLSKFTQ